LPCSGPADGKPGDRRRTALGPVAREEGPAPPERNVDRGAVRRPCHQPHPRRPGWNRETPHLQRHTRHSEPRRPTLRPARQAGRQRCHLSRSTRPTPCLPAPPDARGEMGETRDRGGGEGSHHDPPGLAMIGYGRKSPEVTRALRAAEEILPSSGDLQDLLDNLSESRGRPLRVLTAP